jgi:hypothetical protein
MCVCVSVCECVCVCVCVFSAQNRVIVKQQERETTEHKMPHVKRCIIIFYRYFFCRVKIVPSFGVKTTRFHISKKFFIQIGSNKGSSDVATTENVKIGTSRMRIEKHLARKKVIASLKLFNCN